MSYPLWNMFLTIMWFFLWVLWIVLLFRIITDIFRSRDLGGWAKAGWLSLVIFLPFLGVFLYVIVRGGTLHERYEDDAWEPRRTARGSGRDASGDGSADQLAALTSLRDDGVISEADYQRGKAKVSRY